MLSINERDKLYLMRSIRFSKQKSFHSSKTKGVSDFKTAFDLASYFVHRMSCQDNATFVEQSQELSATLIYLNFLTNVLKIIKTTCETSLLLHALHDVYLSMLRPVKIKNRMICQE